MLRCFALLALALPLLGACSVSGDDDSLRDDAHGTTQTVRQGDEIVVKLRGNPTTGYTWYVATVDEAVLRQVGDADFDPDSDADGAAGVVTLRFEAVERGVTPLELVYRRENEQDSEASRRWQVTVVVEE